MNGYSIAALAMGGIGLAIAISSVVLRAMHISKYGYLPGEGPETEMSRRMTRLGF
jgi:hypothetical protein